MSSATMFASSWPRNSLPSPIAKPRLSQPQHTVEIVWPIWDQCSHRISPVFALSANTSSLPVTIYMMPSLTSGVASSEYLPPNPEPLNRTIQAPLSCLTLLVSICFSVEQRWLVRFPPLVTQSLPTGAWSRRSISGSAALTGIAARKKKPRTINIGTIRGRMVFLPLLPWRRGGSQRFEDNPDRYLLLTRRVLALGGVKSSATRSAYITRR